jgi:hypothetical protein
MAVFLHLNPSCSWGVILFVCAGAVPVRACRVSTVTVSCQWLRIGFDPFIRAVLAF